MIYFAFSYFKLLNICFLKKFKYRLFPNHDLGVNVVARDNAVVGLCLLSFAKLLRDELIYIIFAATSTATTLVVDHRKLVINCIIS
jgi:hypothetical protein